MTSLPPSITAGEFEGPLDLLLDYVREQKVAVEQITMAPLVARFLDYVRSSRECNLDLDIEWLLLAATLIQWKSRSLLPRDPAGAAPSDPVRDELVRQLLAHKRELAEELGHRKTVSDSSLSRSGAAPAAGPAVLEDRPDPAFVSVWDLTQQARELARWAAEYRSALAHWNSTFDVEPESVTVAQMSDWLREYLGQMEALPIDALPLLERQPTLAHCSALFLGLLEMVRDQKIVCEQGEAFQSVWIWSQLR